MPRTHPKKEKDSGRPSVKGRPSAKAQPEAKGGPSAKAQPEAKAQLEAAGAVRPPEPTAEDAPNANGNGADNDSGNNEHRRSGRVTYRPKAAAMLTVHARTEDERLLAPRERPAFLDSDPWRSLRILSEFVEGFDALAAVGKAVTIFGSARIPENDPYCAKARELAGLLAREGFAVITGGGPGIMEAANRGCHEAGGLSIGCNVELPHEQAVNPYVDLGVEFRYFFARKTMFVKYADAFAIFPGGFGTLDELFESLTLIQTGKIRHFPVVLVGTEYWAGLLEWLRTVAIARGAISPEDLALVNVTDDMKEACALLTAGFTRRTQEAAKADKVAERTAGPR